MAKNIPDLDAELDFDEDEEVPTKTVRIFGRNWELKTSVNTFNASAFIALSDGPSIYNYIKGIVVEEQWDDFTAALGKVKNCDFPKLMKIVNAMTEAVVERPTELPSASRPGPTKRTSSPRSAAGTGSKRASTSRR